MLIFNPQSQPQAPSFRTQSNILLVLCMLFFVNLFYNLHKKCPISENYSRMSVLHTAHYFIFDYALYKMQCFHSRSRQISSYCWTSLDAYPSTPGQKYSEAPEPQNLKYNRLNFIANVCTSWDMHSSLQATIIDFPFPLWLWWELWYCQ